jgi:hypothetical protein
VSAGLAPALGKAQDAREDRHTNPENPHEIHAENGQLRRNRAARCGSQPAGADHHHVDSIAEQSRRTNVVIALIVIVRHRNASHHLGSDRRAKATNLDVVGHIRGDEIEQSERGDVQ